MDHMAIADRRRLRRKLRFWRIAALVFLVGIGFSLYAFLSDGNKREAAPHIARVEISGMILDDSDLLDRLGRIAKRDSVKALVVSISSPGGTTYGGERIFKSIRQVAEKKPVVADIRTVAASAGYMVATAADRIVAGESSITGSIGVIFQYPQAGEAMKKLGLSVEEIKSSPMKAEPSPFHPASDEAKAMIRRMIVDSYAWFVDLVAERRKLPREEVLKLADGSIFTGRQALDVKLVDALGGEEEIRRYLEERGVSSSLPIMTWKKQDSGFSSLFAGAFAQILRQAGLGHAISPEILRALGGEKLFLDGLVSFWQVGSD